MMSAAASIWKSETEDGRIRVCSVRQSLRFVLLTGLPVETIPTAVEPALGAVISRSYS